MKNYCHIFSHPYNHKVNLIIIGVLWNVYILRHPTTFYPCQNTFQAFPVI